MTVADFKSKNRIEDVLASRGIKLVGRMAKCPLHEDSSPSFSIEPEKQLWNCHAGCGGGDVIELMARLEGIKAGELMKRLEINGAGFNGSKAIAQQPKTPPKIEKVYEYLDANGHLAFEVVRMVPKTFRQRHRGADGEWVWNMEGVQRVLYKLPDVIFSSTVALCEGEKDAETLIGLGYCATCNVGGAGKWLDGYTDSLAGKDVLIFGDNDEPGRKHVELVCKSIETKVKSSRIIKIPESSKDVSDYVATFSNPKDAEIAIAALVASSRQLHAGLDIPVYSMAEIEPRYAAMVRQSDEHALNLGRWLPTLNKLRPLMPGELAMIVGNTGIGKTALLSSLALAAKPLATLMFQFELPDELMFERFVAAGAKMESIEVERAYKTTSETLGSEMISKLFGHILLCCEPRKTVEQIELLIGRSEMKFGRKPKVVLLDYVQLVAGKGQSRYDRASTIAEDLKSMAKATRTIVIIASQVSRPKDEESPEVGLHDAKESGSLENSCGLVLGAWRDHGDSDKLTLRVLKATRGGAGLDVVCNFNGRNMTITERA